MNVGVCDASCRASFVPLAKKQGKDPTALLGQPSPTQTARYLRDREEVVAEGPSFGDLIRIEAEKVKS
jgi:hypothetical protein